MSDDEARRRPPDMETLDLDSGDTDLESAALEALRAVEKVERHRQDDPSSEPPAASEEAAPDPEIARLQQEISDLRDRSVRTLADFDNFRKRADREREEMRRYALTGFLREMVDVLDNLDLALAAPGGAEDLKRGVEMIRRQFQELLRRHGVVEFDALGERFDPAIHEAVSRDEDPSVDAPRVRSELRRGYRIHDRLLRPAMVRVALPANPTPAETAGPAAASEGGEEPEA